MKVGNSIKNERSSIEEDIILLKDFTEGNFKRDKLENYRGSYKMGYFYYKDIQQAIEHILKELKRFENMYEAEHQIHLVRNEQLDRKQKAIIKCNELENENKELKKENEKLKHKIEGQECVIEKQAHNEEVYEKLVMKLEKENEELKADRNNNYQMIALAQNKALGYMQGYEDGKKLKRSAVANIVENQQYYIFNKQIEHYKEYIVKLQKENKELKEYISIAPNLDKMTAVKYRNIQQDAYIKGRAEEQHRLFEAIMKIADQREELKKTCYTMAEYIVKLDIDEDICKHIKCSEGDKEREECIECVINHFKNK